MEWPCACAKCSEDDAPFTIHVYLRRVLCDMCWKDVCEYIVENCDFSQQNARAADTIYLCGGCSDEMRASRLPPEVTVRLTPTFTATIASPKWVFHEEGAATRIHRLGTLVPGQPRRIAGFRPLPSRLSPCSPASTQEDNDEMASEASCETGASDDDLCDGTCVRVALSEEQRTDLRHMCMDEDWVY